MEKICPSATTLTSPPRAVGSGAICVRRSGTGLISPRAARAGGALMHRTVSAIVKARVLMVESFLVLMGSSVGEARLAVAPRALL